MEYAEENYLELLDHIPRTASGKFQAVICNVSQEEIEQLEKHQIGRQRILRMCLRQAISVRFVYGVLMITLLLVVMSWEQVEERLTLNAAAMITLRGLVANSRQLSSAEAALVGLNTQNCRADWFRGLVANALGQEARRDAAWETVVRCSADYIPMLYVVAPDHRRLAELAVHERPQSATTWFWLARTLTCMPCGWTAPVYEHDRGWVIQVYRQGLALDPFNGLRWRELGDLLAGRDAQAAIEAYLQSCYNGDPGANGCWRAGLTAERLGDIRAAIRYYRLSRWSGALERAAQLEQQLLEQTSP